MFDSLRSRAAAAWSFARRFTPLADEDGAEGGWSGFMVLAVDDDARELDMADWLEDFTTLGDDSSDLTRVDDDTFCFSVDSSSQSLFLFL